MRSIKRTALIFGAGKTGRGFVGHLCSISGFDMVFIDKDRELITRLKEAGSYNIVLLNEKRERVRIVPRDYLLTSDPGCREIFASADICFTAVFGNNLKELSKTIAEGIEYRLRDGNSDTFNIITCENLSHAASLLREYVIENLDPGQSVQYLESKVGFVEGIVLKTCLSDTDDALGVAAQDLYDLPCDRDSFKGQIPDIAGLKPLSNFKNQLTRKIYTYNCINAVITYLGAEKGYKYLAEAANDQEIYHLASEAGEEASKALIAEFNFDPAEQKEWVANALNKFADAGIPDPISRNGADPKRKLGKDDRLVGPAILALKHNLVPEAILKGILSAFRYKDNGTSIESAADLLGLDTILEQVCGLRPADRLYQLIKEKHRK